MPLEYNASMNKVFSYISVVSGLVAFVFISFFGFTIPNVNAQDVNVQGLSSESSKDTTIEESNKIYNEFGGKKGEVPVTMFVTSWCPVCTALEKTFKNANIEFAKADVESNRDAMLYYQKLIRGRPSGVPATLVGEELFMGYDTANIVKAIKVLREKEKSKATERKAQKTT